MVQISVRLTTLTFFSNIIRNHSNNTTTTKAKTNKLTYPMMMITTQNSKKLLPFKFAILLLVVLLLHANALCHGMRFPAQHESTIDAPCYPSPSSRIHTGSLWSKGQDNDDPFLCQDDAKLPMLVEPGSRRRNLDYTLKNRPTDNANQQPLSLSMPILPSTATRTGGFLGDAFFCSPPTKGATKRRPASTYGSVCVLETSKASHQRLFLTMMSPHDRDKEVSHANNLISKHTFPQSSLSTPLPPIIPAAWLKYAAMPNPPTETFSIKQVVQPLSKVINGIEWMDPDRYILGQNTTFPISLDTSTSEAQEKLPAMIWPGSSYSHKLKYVKSVVDAQHLQNDIFLPAKSWLAYSQKPKYDAHIQNNILQDIKRYFTFKLTHN